MPWPSSALPVKTVMPPSAADANPAVEEGLRLEAAGQRWHGRLGWSLGDRSRADRERDDEAAAGRQE